MNNKLKLTFITLALSTILTGCGDNNTVDKTGFISGDNDFDNAKMYFVSQEVATKIKKDNANDSDLIELKSASDALEALSEMPIIKVNEETTKPYIDAIEKAGFNAEIITKAVEENNNKLADYQKELNNKINILVEKQKHKIAETLAEINLDKKELKELSKIASTSSYKIDNLKSSITADEESIDYLYKYGVANKDGEVNQDYYDIKVINRDLNRKYQLISNNMSNYNINSYTTPLADAVSSVNNQYKEQINEKAEKIALENFLDNAEELDISDSGGFDMPKIDIKNKDNDSAIAIIDLKNVKGKECSTITITEDKNWPLIEAYNKKDGSAGCGGLSLKDYAFTYSSFQPY